MTFPIHLDTLTSFWQAEEKRLSKHLATIDPETIDGMIARKWWLGARANVRRLQEMVDAVSWAPWSFYRYQAESIAREFRLV